MDLIGKNGGETYSIMWGVLIGGLITLFVAWIYFRKQRRSIIAATLFEADTFSIGVLANKICHLLRHSTCLTGDNRLAHIKGSFPQEIETRLLANNVTRIQADILSLRAQFISRRRVKEIDNFAEWGFYWGFWSPFYQTLVWFKLGEQLSKASNDYEKMIDNVVDDLTQTLFTYLEMRERLTRSIDRLFYRFRSISFMPEAPFIEEAIEDKTIAISYLKEEVPPLIASYELKDKKRQLKEISIEGKPLLNWLKERKNQ